MIPQLSSPECLACTDFWSDFLSELKEHRSSIQPNAQAVEAIISAQVDAILSQATVFPTRVYAKGIKEPDISSWLALFYICLATQTSAECAALFQKMQVVWARSPEDEKDWIAQYFIKEVVEELEASIEGTEGVYPGVEPYASFFRFAFEVYFNRVLRLKPREFSVSTLAKTVLWSGSYMVMRERCVSIGAHSPHKVK